MFRELLTYSSNMKILNIFDVLCASNIFKQKQNISARQSNVDAVSALLAILSEKSVWQHKS